mmetsp:Transcript_63240/g.181885  ORF Transcript_63240/g.181885 Transcript_63240/m.181885 type:complete len:200 (-) Transcript_63240:932-1531(-)
MAVGTAAAVAARAGMRPPRARARGEPKCRPTATSCLKPTILYGSTRCSGTVTPRDAASRCDAFSARRTLIRRSTLRFSMLAIKLAISWSSAANCLKRTSSVMSKSTMRLALSASSLPRSLKWAGRPPTKSSYASMPTDQTSALCWPRRPAWISGAMYTGRDPEAVADSGLSARGRTKPKPPNFTSQPSVAWQSPMSLML